MNTRHLTLIEVLQPRSFQVTPERARVTRTIVQPEIDAFELMEAQSGKGGAAAPGGRAGGDSAAGHARA